MSDTERASPHSPDKYNTSAPTATVSSLKSEDSTEHLICKKPLKKTNKIKEVKEQSVTSKSVEAGSEAPNSRRRLVVFLGLGQVVLGALLVGAGALAVVKGAALSRVGAGLWAGCVAVVAGVVGVLAGINDCYGLYGVGSGSPLLTAFLALSLLCLACGNSAAVLAASGLQRDALRAQPTAHTSFDDEMQAWTPVLANIALLIIAALHCLLCVVTIYHLSKRVCPCFKPKQAFDHNQFDPGFKAVPFVVHVDEGKKTHDVERVKNHELCQDLEVKLQGETLKKKKDESGEFDSANSKEKLVTRWLGRHSTPAPAGAAGAAGRPARRGVRKQRPVPQVVLLPHGRPHPASTGKAMLRRRRRGQQARHPAAFGFIGESDRNLYPPPAVNHVEIAPSPHRFHQLGRMPANCVMVPPARYATLPLPPPAPFYYPIHDNRVRRRRSPRAHGERRRREHARERDSQLARSLERIHRKRRSEHGRPTAADLKRTYTGLDRAYAEQFIAVIDESRHAAEQHDSLASTATSDSADSHGAAS